MKFAIAVAIIGASALLMGWGFQNFPGGTRLAPWWYLAVVFIIQTRELGDVAFYYGLGAVTIGVALGFAVISPWTQSKMSDIGR